ncbi:hypothetical protein M3Y97_00204200 [Aphelenchoides bicaudatus]|nr:hypothetical protein M3Y97_00204200 [Aphelenchoides bicaudatus]
MVEFGKALERKPCLQSNLCAKNYLPELTIAFPNLPKDIFMTRCGKTDPKTELIPFAQKCWKFDNISRLALSSKQQDVLEIDSSYLQSFKFFKRDTARRLFDFSPLVRHYVDSYTKVLFEGADEMPKFCVHLRGGDFSDHILLPSEIDSAFTSINYLLKKYTVGGLCWLLLFSDDARISSQLEDSVKNFSINTQTHIVTALSRVESLYLASTNCDVFLLTSPGSTFGWWAAFLVEDRKQDQIYYIDRFFKPEFLSEYLSDFDENDFFPAQWQRLNILMDDVFSSRTAGIYENILFS